VLERSTLGVQKTAGSLLRSSGLPMRFVQKFGVVFCSPQCPPRSEKVWGTTHALGPFTGPRLKDKRYFKRKSSFYSDQGHQQKTPITETTHFYGGLRKPQKVIMKRSIGRNRYNRCRGSTTLQTKIDAPNIKRNG
jgi:hypothetical protein